jgi:hypothetical protein
VKVQIIYLDPHDDHVSAREKIAWTQAPRVLLVWPSRGKILQREVDLVLLQRFASDRGTRIGLVTHDPAVLENAHRLGIPTFDAPDNIPADGWHIEKPRKDKRDAPYDRVHTPQVDYTPQWRIPQQAFPEWVRILTALGITLVVFLMLLLVLPSIRISITPAVDQDEIQIQLPVSTDGALQTDGTSLPVRKETVRLQAQDRIPTTGSVKIPSTYAQGSVTLTNLSNDPVSIPAGTLLGLKTGVAIQFATLDDVELPGGEGLQTTALVQADRPGSEGNIQGDAALEIIGPLNELVIASNPDPIVGGGETSRNAPDRSNLELLHDKLVAKLIEDASANITARLREGEILIPNSLSVVKLIVEVYDHAEGEPADTISLEMDAEIGGIVVERPALEAVILSDHFDPGQSKHRIIPDSLTISRLEVSDDPASGGETLHLTATVLVEDLMDLNPLRARIRLKPIAKARQMIMEELKLTSPPEMEIRPSWFPLVPLLDVQILFETGHES